MIKRLSNLQWQAVMDVADEMRLKNSEYERTIFILHIF